MAKIIDARGQSCPIPVVMTKEALADKKSGVIIVLVDEEVAKENVKRLARSLNCKVEITCDTAEFKLTITKTEV